jgi:glyoxylase-like metal-dependent hydrolase (beta-lactamase superfamily II)
VLPEQSDHPSYPARGVERNRFEDEVAKPGGLREHGPMNDQSLAPVTPAVSLEYPFKSLPEPGRVVQVAPGVYWLRMPLPMALNHINLWALADGDGWTIVDTGMQTSPIAAAWEEVISGPLAGKPVKRVVCTHMHPDHVGMAGWLSRRFDCPFWMTRLEYVTCRMLVADTGREAPADALRFYRASGWKYSDLEHYKARFGGFGKMVYALPDSYHRVSEGDQLLVGEHRWHAVIGRGHSPEHLCLYCPQLRLLISGDQVLPKITSNVSVFPTEPEADPLTDWLESLASIRATVPDEVLVLPAHNEPFYGLHRRIEQLTRGHERSLQRLLDQLTQPKTACDVFSLLFRRPVAGEMLQMATGESVAHLNCLIRRGQVTCSVDNAGVAWYRAS